MGVSLDIITTAFLQARIEHRPSLRTMANQLDRLKRLPWMELLLNALLTALCVTVAEFILVLLMRALTIVAQIAIVLFNPPLGILTQLAIGVGIGALAVVLLERFFPQVRIDTGTLWALIPCLIVALIARTLLPSPVSLISTSQITAVAILLGVFLRGRRYWRY